MMTSKNLLRIAILSASLVTSAAAFAQAAAPAPAPASASAPAKAKGKHQNHHCKQADGTMDMSKTKKACLADKGTWLKDDAAAAAAASTPKK